MDGEKSLEQLMGMAKKHRVHEDELPPQSKPDPGLAGKLLRRVKALKLSALWCRWSLLAALVAMLALIAVFYFRGSDDAAQEPMIQMNPSFDNFPDLP